MRTFTVLSLFATLQAGPCCGLLFPSQSNGNNLQPGQGSNNNPFNRLSYQTSPDATDYIVNGNGVDNRDIYPNFDEEDPNGGYSILDFLRSKNPGTGYVEQEKQSSYYTLDPTMEMLVDWTLDYVGTYETLCACSWREE